MLSYLNIEVVTSLYGRRVTTICNVAMDEYYNFIHLVDSDPYAKALSVRYNTIPAGKLHDVIDAFRSVNKQLKCYIK